VVRTRVDIPGVEIREEGWAMPYRMSPPNKALHLTAKGGSPD
jgi:hypothetical protein